MEPGDWPAEAEPGCMRYPVEQRGRRTRVTSPTWKPKVELLACGTEVETGARQTRAMTEGVRTTTEKPKVRRRTVEPETCKSTAEQQQTEADPNG